MKIREKDSKEIEKRKDGEQGRGKDNQTKQLKNRKTGRLYNS